MVVDSGSTDGTRDIAKYYTNNFFHRAFDEYASQKNFGAQQAKNDWVFSIDADEVMTPELRFEIQALLKDGPVYDRYSVHRDNRYFGHSANHVFGNDCPVRLYNRCRSEFKGSVHETVVGGKCGEINASIVHNSCQSRKEWVEKNRHYIRLDASRQFRKGRRFSIWHCLISPFRVLLFRAIRLQGWRDGFPGLLIAIELAYSTIIFQMELRKLINDPGFLK